MTAKEDQNILHRAVQDEDPRDMLAACEMPAVERQQEKMLDRLKRVHTPDTNEKAMEISEWVDIPEM